MNIEDINIHGKIISIFENHNEAVIPWMNTKSINNIRPALLTFDYHTDTHLAFLHYHYKLLGEFNSKDFNISIQKTNNLIVQLKTQDDIKKALTNIRNDEHIDFAIRTNIISHAYVITHSECMTTTKSEETKAWEKENLNIVKINMGTQAPKPIKHTFIMPWNRIIELDLEHFINMEIYEQKQKSDLSIEDTNLIHRMNKIKIINQSLFGVHYNFTNNFILDIDLDYFNTLKSINPKEISIFYSLIRQAQSITIAKESYFVNDCKLDNENISVQILLETLLKHINIALSITKP